MHLQQNYWVFGYCLQNQDDQIHEQYHPGEARHVQCLQEAGSDIIFTLTTNIEKEAQSSYVRYLREYKRTRSSERSFIWRGP